MGVAFNVVQGMQRYMYKRNTVYSIPCQQCPKKYVGQTTAIIKKRCSEHRNWCQKKNKKKILKTYKKKAGIAFHYHEMGHAMDFENTQIIAEEFEKHAGF